ncbi:LLM class F420-dependent oxidoreductase [Sphingobium sp. AN558]|uniref:LLM class F420-dependent oxidoreductase n=1 Tax=Sphingobium sp. AN558 TaxID=3133442 RepID=UPI0030C56F5C
MKYGICCSQLLGIAPSAQDVIDFAQEAERLGFNSIVVGEHILMPRDFDDSVYPAGTFEGGTPWYDPLVFLAVIAGATKTIRLGTGVAVVAYRQPVPQAQAIATLDFMSGGRLFYGAGVGWMREEFEALGVPFAERGARCDEYIEVMKLLWSGSTEPFQGKFISFNGGRINPLPTQKPHPPILIGGETSPALRRIARLGDGFYINWKSLPEYRKLMDELAGHMADRGRSMSQLYGQLGATEMSFVQAQKAAIPEYEASGVHEIIFSPKCYSVDEGMATMRQFAEEFIG